MTILIVKSSIIVGTLTNSSYVTHHHQVKSRKMSEHDYDQQITEDPSPKFNSLFKILNNPKKSSDEEDSEIGSSSTSRSCNPGYYECQVYNGSRVICISIGSICDGRQDCPSNDDEIEELCNKQENKIQPKQGDFDQVFIGDSDDQLVGYQSTSTTERVPSYVERIINSSMEIKDKMMESAIKIKSMAEKPSKKRESEKNLKPNDNMQPITLINFGSMIIGDRNVAGNENKIGNGNGNGNHNEEPKETCKNYTEKMKEDL